MPWAVDFLPCHIIEFTNLVTRSDPYTGSAATPRFAICPFLGMFSVLSSQFSVANGYSSRRTENREPRTAFKLSWAALLRTSSVPDCVPQPPPRRASRAQRDNELRADPSHGHRESAQSSAPVDCGQYRGCMWSLQCRW